MPESRKDAPIERPLSQWRWYAASAVFAGGAAALLAAGMKGKLEGPGMFGWIALAAAVVCASVARLVSPREQAKFRNVTFGGFLVLAVAIGLLMTLVTTAIGAAGGALLALIDGREVGATAWSGTVGGATLGGIAGLLVVASRAVTAAAAAIGGGPSAPRTWLAVPRDVAVLSGLGVVAGSASATLAALRFLDLSPFEAPDLLLLGPAVLFAIATVIRARQGRKPQRSVR